jgi:hypothetical protein
MTPINQLRGIAANQCGSKKMKLLAQLVGLVILVCAFTLLISLLPAEVQARMYGSDSLHAFLLAQDVLKDPNSLFLWHHCPALYVFPDWLLATATIFCVPTPWHPLLYSAILAVMLCLAGGAAIHESARTSVSRGSLTIATILFGLQRKIL